MPNSSWGHTETSPAVMCAPVLPFDPIARGTLGVTLIVTGAPGCRA